ncbi:MAG: glycosyltransferase family 2 protein [Magnetococcales bacterium]|nr:glycosyltransferase family 2 protein [Magnetococcales bacterium]
MRPKVTVYITCHNYGRFLRQSIDSVLKQILSEWELIIINDGSQDDSKQIIDDYVERYPKQMRAFHNQKPRRLPYCANLALREAKGQYLVRLDADDYLDESALLAMASYLDKNHEIALVYPNYIYIDEDGSYLGVENRKIVGQEAELLDLPAHGACTMVRKRVLKCVGGYDEKHTAQDGYELWLKIFNRYKVANLRTPLFFYRQHTLSLSRDENRILNARQKIKRAMAARLEGDVKPRIIGIVPAKNTNTERPNVVMEPVAGIPLIDHTLNAAIESGAMDQILVTSDDQAVLDHCAGFPNILTVLRDMKLSQSHVRLMEVLQDAVDRLEQDFDLYPDILVILNTHCPLRRSQDIRKAIDTLLLYDVSSVHSVYEDFELHFSHGKQGLEPINRGMMNQLRLEREALYVDNGAIRVVWRDMIGKSDWFRYQFGHIVMPLERSMIYAGRTESKLRYIEQILENDAQDQ